jgi:hypothetical protein
MIAFEMRLCLAPNAFGAVSADSMRRDSTSRLATPKIVDRIELPLESEAR